MFPDNGKYRLEATSGDANASLPPVLDFQCSQQSFTQRLDHFSSSDTRTWQQVYWICNDAFPTTAAEQQQSGVIYVFLGNEAPLGTPRQPICFENARRHHALVVLVEHRQVLACIVPYCHSSHVILVEHRHTLECNLGVRVA